MKFSFGPIWSTALWGRSARTIIIDPRQLHLFALKFGPLGNLIVIRIGTHLMLFGRHILFHVPTILRTICGLRFLAFFFLTRLAFSRDFGPVLTGVG